MALGVARNRGGIDAAPAILWTLIADSNELADWGPPVTGVEVLANGQSEGLGTAGKVLRIRAAVGIFRRARVEHVPGRKIAYVIDEDSFGL